MNNIPPSLDISLNMKRRSCIIDTHLALSRFGLLLTQRLGDEFNIWLVRELWQILDNTQHYLSNPELLRPLRAGAKRPENGKSIRDYISSEALNQWDMARIETDLAGLKIFWIADAINESLLPKGVDQDLVCRYETLASSLDLRIGDRDENIEPDNIFIDCFRDAAALTAALNQSRGFILTRQDSESEDLPESEPVICTYFREWGIKCFRVGTDQKTRMEREFILPIFARSGISELMWAGLRLAAVHIVVPEAIIMPKVKKEDNEFQNSLPILDEEDDVSDKDWWSEAVCFWYSL